MDGILSVLQLLRFALLFFFCFFEQEPRRKTRCASLAGTDTTRPDRRETRVAFHTQSANPKQSFCSTATASSTTCVLPATRSHVITVCFTENHQGFYFEEKAKQLPQDCFMTQQQVVILETVWQRLLG